MSAVVTATWAETTTVESPVGIQQQQTVMGLGSAQFREINSNIEALKWKLLAISTRQQPERGSAFAEFEHLRQQMFATNPALMVISSVEVLQDTSRDLKTVIERESATLFQYQIQPVKTGAAIDQEFSENSTPTETVISTVAGVSPSNNKNSLQSTAVETGTAIISAPTTQPQQQRAAHQLSPAEAVAVAVGVLAVLNVTFLCEASGLVNSSAAADTATTTAASQQTSKSSSARSYSRQQHDAEHPDTVSVDAVPTSPQASSVAAFPYDPGGRSRVYDPGGRSRWLLLLGDALHPESVADSQQSTQCHHDPSHALSMLREDQQPQPNLCPKGRVRLSTEASCSRPVSPRGISSTVVQ